MSKACFNLLSNSFNHSDTATATDTTWLMLVVQLVLLEAHILRHEITQHHKLLVLDISIANGMIRPHEGSSNVMRRGFPCSSRHSGRGRRRIQLGDVGVIDFCLVVESIRRQKLQHAHIQQSKSQDFKYIQIFKTQIQEVN